MSFVGCRNSSASLNLIVRRCVSSIDRSVLFTAGILLLALRIQFAYTLQRIVQKLRSKYPILSDDLGRPIPALALGIWVSVLFLFLASLQYQRLTNWFIRGTYRKLNDEEITRLARRLKSYGLIYAVGYTVLLGYAVVRLNG